ncbi:uncharacterized protein PODANS_3_11540 [Podospora anserina S mat+]|uniref:Podospora anserina S mat+ genomic DNA chromosome 3, supercontig 3 n=1 Tax=Podospora anserina (strain S / ATCC MYA-4624 / DSM 980 / FGSC 10383) TaxID=515849 RepID=B2ACT1_PODAN|nr:uncharacterized protein PODANS_3_11540 [Podospora anserina S mat+]CAP61246.1 unnamed protein product [Podospora anserina S mat+]CDP27600.1 Putative Serine/threonine-protein kinase [Podospora anserina S mat+]
MTVDAILRDVSKSPLSSWWLEKFDTDVVPNIYVSPVQSRLQYPAYHLTCYLEPNSHYARTLTTASDSKNSGIEEREIREIAKDILSRLNKWSMRLDLRHVLQGVTIGSRFRLDDTNGMTGDAAGIWLAPNYELHKRYLPMSRLTELWKPYIASSELPPLIDFDVLRSRRRLHNSISEVLLPSGEVVIFKSVIRVVASMYHEMRELLRMPPHPNIMSRPQYIVTRRVSGAEQPIVCGFILRYLPGGSLLEWLTTNQSEPAVYHPLLLQTKIKWIRQIILALGHLYGPAKSFHSALRPDNIVIDENDNIVLVDFEQRGSSRRWQAPPLWREDRLSQVAADNPDWAESRVNPANMPKGVFYSCPNPLNHSC